MPGERAMHLKPLTAVLAVSLLALSPAPPVFGPLDGGAAHAKGEKGGGGGGKSESKSESKGKSEAKTTKQEKSTKAAKAAKTETASKKAEVTKAKGKPVAEDGTLHPSQLGKMNGAMNANINAVLAHIRNGQTTKGPVGLLAGLAIADAGAAEGAAAAELLTLAAAFDDLDTAVADAGFASVEEYLQAKADGTLTPEQEAAAEDIDSLIAAVGGTAEDGLTLASTPPTEEEILAAEEAAAASAQSVADAEQAIGDAWNKDGDLAALLAQLREKLAPYQDQISAAVAETSQVEDPAELLPEEDSAELLPEGALVIE
jgi:hypothetical protein